MNCNASATDGAGFEHLCGKPKGHKGEHRSDGYVRDVWFGITWSVTDAEGYALAYSENNQPLPRT